MNRVMRVAVINDGVKVNTILVDEDKLDTYWPGYGDGMIVEGVEPEEDKPVPQGRPEKFAVYEVTPDKPLATGDRIDLKTGTVTKAEVAEPAVVEEVIKK